MKYYVIGRNEFMPEAHDNVDGYEFTEIIGNENWFMEGENAHHWKTQYAIQVAKRILENEGIHTNLKTTKKQRFTVILDDCEPISGDESIFQVSRSTPRSILNTMLKTGPLNKYNMQFIGKHNHCKIINNNPYTNKNCIIFGDSMTIAMASFIAKFFKNTQIYDYRSKCRWESAGNCIKFCISLNDKKHRNIDKVIQYIKTKKMIDIIDVFLCPNYSNKLHVNNPSQCIEFKSRVFDWQNKECKFFSWNDNNRHHWIYDDAIKYGKQMMDIEHIRFEEGYNYIKCHGLAYGRQVCSYIPVDGNYTVDLLDGTIVTGGKEILYVTDKTPEVLKKYSSGTGDYHKTFIAPHKKCRITNNDIKTGLSVCVICDSMFIPIAPLLAKSCKTLDVFDIRSSPVKKVNVHNYDRVFVCILACDSINYSDVKMLNMAPRDEILGSRSSISTRPNINTFYKNHCIML